MPTDWYRMLHQEPSSFTPSTWDRHDFQALAEFSPTLAQADRDSIAFFGRSLTSDAFMALRGLSPRLDDPMAESWRAAQALPEFKALQRQFDRGDTQEKVISVLAVQRAATASLSENNDQQKQLEQAGVTPLTDEEMCGIGEDELGEALGEAEQLAKFVSFVGGQLHGGPSQVFEQALDLAQQIHLEDFAAILGFTRRVVSGASRDTHAGTEQFTGYRPAGLNDQTVARDLVGLANGDMPTLARMADEALDRRDFRSKQPLGKGPVVVMRDESGSMGGSCLRVRHQRALAFEMALADSFNQDGRDLISIRWGSFPVEPFVYGEDNLDAHLRSFLNHGSTEPYEALRLAVKVADEYVPGADVLMITDGGFSRGQAGTLAALLRDFRATGGRVWVVVIGASVDPAAMAWADGYITLDQLSADEGMEAIISGMANRPGEAGDRVIVD